MHLETDLVANGMDIRSELSKFHTSYYRSDLMTLVVAGRQSTDTLKRWVENYFSDTNTRESDVCPSDNNGSTQTCEAKEIDRTDPVSAWWGHFKPVHDRNSSLIYVEIEPIKDMRRLEIAWPIWLPTAKDRDSIVLVSVNCILCCDVLECICNRRGLRRYCLI
jgi:secreted Zn-dependent insulinase-like peptidase